MIHLVHHFLLVYLFGVGVDGRGSDGVVDLHDPHLLLVGDLFLFVLQELLLVLQELLVVQRSIPFVSLGFEGAQVVLLLLQVDGLLLPLYLDPLYPLIMNLSDILGHVETGPLASERVVGLTHFVYVFVSLSFGVADLFLLLLVE